MLGVITPILNNRLIHFKLMEESISITQGRKVKGTTWDYNNYVITLF